MTEPTQAGIHYHTDAAGRRWRIRVRWDRVNRQRLLAERQALIWSYANMLVANMNSTRQIDKISGIV